MMKTYSRIIPFLAVVLGLVSCNKEAPNPLASEVAGMWWKLIEQKGTLPENFGGADYTRIGNAVFLGETGSGYGVTFFFNDDEGDPIYVIGGESVAGLTYTTSVGGSIKLNFDKAYIEYADYYRNWTMTYSGGSITASDGKSRFTLDKASDAMTALIKEWDWAANGGLAPSNFAANTDFTPTAWRTEEWIYIYDGYGTDHPSKNGFSIIPLPWNKDQRESNLAQDFCDYITPENGWELALNYCGISPLKNYNYFALYNKYTGILRFFTYIPQGLNVSDANDHMWQVNTGDEISKLMPIRYGVPNDLTLKDKAQLGQTGSGFTQYVTPWVNNYSVEGYVMPAAGWWAFDIDLSLYRPGIDLSDDFITLTMRSWNNSHVSLYSTVAAGINGDMKQVADKAEDKAACTIGGVKMSAKTLKETGSSIVSMFKGAASGDLGGLISGGISLGKNALTLAGIISEEEEKQNLFNASISLQLDGTINTDGLITGSRAVTGIVSPSISFSKFDTKNSHVGQGVWNLKTSPVVYRVSDATLASGVGYRIGYTVVNTDNRNHPYPGNMTVNNQENNKYLNLYSMPTFLDPSSIEVELNPEVFPEDQIEWIKVDAICGWQPKNGFEGTDSYRNAYGLTGRGDPNKYDFWPYLYVTGYGKAHNWLNPLCDFLYDSSDKMGLHYPKTTPFVQCEDDSYDAVYGRGNDEYILEPQIMYGQRESSNVGPRHFMPALEVTVIVTVKMKNATAPYMLSRAYLPEYKTVSHDRADLEKLYGTIVPNILHSPKQVKSELNEYQLDRLSHIFEWLEPGFISITTDDIGKVMGADGNIYDNAGAATAAGTNAVAMIAYVGNDTGDATYNHGLAIALRNDIDETDWNTAMAYCASKAEVPGGKWSLPSRDQWELMIKANGNISGLNAAIVNAGGKEMKGGYWSASEYDSSRRYFYDIYGGDWHWVDNAYKGNRARACLAF